MGELFAALASAASGGAHALFHILTTGTKVIARLHVLALIIVLRSASREAAWLHRGYLVLWQRRLACTLRRSVTALLEAFTLAFGFSFAALLHAATARRAGAGCCRTLARSAARLSAFAT